MKHLYLAQDNAYNYIFIRDMEKDENDTLVVNWDLSNGEIDEIVKKFQENENDSSFYVDAEQEWEPFEDVIDRMNTFKYMA